MNYANGLFFVASLVLVSYLSACNPFSESCEAAKIEGVYFTAVKAPSNFDSALSNFDVEEGISRCLRKFSDETFQNEQAQLVDCRQFLTGSSAWNACHEVAESYQMQGVILTGVANAVEGNSSFATSLGGQYLIVAKTTLGVTEYEAFIDSLRELIQ